jgi:hypothetical protein
VAAIVAVVPFFREPEEEEIIFDVVPRGSIKRATMMEGSQSAVNAYRINSNCISALSPASKYFINGV